MPDKGGSPATQGVSFPGRDIAGGAAWEPSPGQTGRAMVPVKHGGLSRPTGPTGAPCVPPAAGRRAGPVRAWLFSPQAHGQTFTFPDLFPEKKLSPEGGSADDNIRDQLLEAQQRKESRDPQRGGVPEWFGL